MKKQFLFIFAFFFSFSLVAQSSGYKKWVLLEHFTNTRCSICGSANPSFYNRWSAFPDDMHHISYHPNVPYPNCAIHLTNPTENNKRKDFYGIFSTPRVLKNGQGNASVGATSSAILSDLVGDKSPLLVQVSESGGMQRTINLEVFSHPTMSLPSDDLKLYVAVVEKTVNYNAPNGESVHHNVFRKMLVDGENFSAAAASGSVSIQESYSIDSDWVASETYVMAWVQSGSTKEVFNSGSSLDPVFTNTQSAYTGSVLIGPNPVSNTLNIKFDKAESGMVEVYSLLGKRIKNIEFADANLSLDLSDVQEGIYLVRLQTQEGILTRRIVVKR